jgi:hypothetical protein
MRIAAEERGRSFVSGFDCAIPGSWVIRAPMQSESPRRGIENINVSLQRELLTTGGGETSSVADAIAAAAAFAEGHLNSCHRISGRYYPRNSVSSAFNSSRWLGVV